jgi:hypothetical protein
MSDPRNIIITPNRGQASEPKIEFIGSSSAPISLIVKNNNDIAFTGSEGEIFSLTSNLTSGTIFSVNDGSGIPVIELDADGDLTLAGYGGNVGVGQTLPSYKLDVNGTLRVQGASTITSITGTVAQFAAITATGNSSLGDAQADTLLVSGSIRGEIEVSGNITTASYTVTNNDYGKTLLFSSSAAQNITCSSGLPVGFNVTAIQLGNGQLNFSSSVQLVNRFSHTSSAGIYSSVSVVTLNGSQYLLVGDTA